MPLAQMETIRSGWRTGEQAVDGFDNPAGPLFVGGPTAESQLVEADFALGTHCSSCTASRPVLCC